MDLDRLNLEDIVNDVLEQAGDTLSETAREGYEELGRGVVRLRFDFTPVEESDKMRMDAKLLGYQEQEEVRKAELGEEVDELLASYDPDNEGVALFTVAEGETGYFQFTLAG